MRRIRFSAMILLVLALAAAALPARAQEGGTAGDAADGAAIILDEGGFGVVTEDALAAGAEAVYAIALRGGDRVAMDLQGESDSVAVTQFAASYGALELESLTAFQSMAWAPEDGSYTITVQNSGGAPAGFTLRLAVSAAPLPTAKILTADADGQSIPMTAGEPFQLMLDAQTSGGYVWTLGEFDTAVLTADGDPALVLLGTMPGAMSRQIFSFTAAAPGTAPLTLTYGRENAAVEKTYSVTVDVADAEAAADAVEAADSAEVVQEPPAEPAPILPDPIALDEGHVLVIPLQGNPSTGFAWGIEPSAEGILSLRGDPAYTSGNDAPGAPGYEVFTFDAVGPGDVTLTFTYRQPWDETTPPAEQFVLPFSVAAAAPPAPPAPVAIGIDQNGGAVEVQAGGMLFVDLPGNPTTGYIWQITDKDDAVLEPTDYEFRGASDAMGAGGVEHFEFTAVAPGEVTLAFAQSRPWETDAEPSATYSVTVKVVAQP